jgi:hypothetical protein
MSNATLSQVGSRIEPGLKPDGPLPDASTAQAAGGGSAAAPRSVKRAYAPIVAGLAALAVAAAAIVVWLRTPAPKPTPAPATQEAAPVPSVAPTGVPEIRHPITEAAPADAAPLPVLAASDGLLAEALAALFGRATLDRYLVPEDVIRHIVVTVDNLPRATYAQRLSPVKAVPGAYAPGKAGDRMAVAAAQPRYAPYVDALAAVDAQRLVALYVRWYPLFQEAYRDLGYPKGYFNDRVVDVLDLLIATPEPAGTLALVQPKVLYEFADPALETLPSGQKLLLRMGPENARRVKAKLVEIRKLVAAQKP